MEDLVRVEDGLNMMPASGDRNPALVYLAGLAASGRRTMAGKLKVVARLLGGDDPVSLPWHGMRYTHVVAIRTRLQEIGYAPATINATLQAIRGVCYACFNLEVMDAADLQRIRGVKPIRSERLPAGRAITPGELNALMDACSSDPSPAGVRDAAIIGLLYAGGLRRSEVVTLDVESYDQGSGELVVTGKGDKQRLLYVDNGAADALADLLLILGYRSGPMFVPIDKGGTIHRGRRMSDQSVYNVLKKRAEEAGVRDVRCHDLRRSFVSDLLDAGADISITAKLAGHSQVQTTARYDRRGEDAKRKAVALLHVPYRRRKVQCPDGACG